MRQGHPPVPGRVFFSVKTNRTGSIGASVSAAAAHDNQPRLGAPGLNERAGAAGVGGNPAAPALPRPDPSPAEAVRAPVPSPTVDTSLSGQLHRRDGENYPSRLNRLSVGASIIPCNHLRVSGSQPAATVLRATPSARLCPLDARRSFGLVRPRPLAYGRGYWRPWDC